MKSFIFGLLVLAVAACGGPLGGGGGGSSSNDFKSNDQNTDTKFLHLDLNKATALFTMQSSGSVVSDENLPEGAVKGSSSSTTTSQVQKVDSDGNTVDALRIFSAETGGAFADTEGLESDYHKNLPRVSYLGISPKKEAFLLFERCFIYRNKATVNGSTVSIGDYKDPWSCSSPFTCQIFKANKKVDEYTSADNVKTSNLTCLSDSLEINTWDFRSGLMQFDSSGNAFFSAHVPGNWKNVLIKYNYGAGTLTEVINANICYRDFLVTSTGGILYTGMTSTSGECSGDSFFRLVTSQGTLQEITRGWWNYSFQPIPTGTYSGQVIFYGPDTASSAPSWDSACFRRFNPGATDSNPDDGVDDRSTLIAECRNDMWGWVNDGSATNATKQARCTAAKYLFGSSNIPQKILIKDLDSDGKEEAYIVGVVQYKQAGTWQTDNWCQQPSNNWTKQYNGLAKVANLDGGSDPTDNITLLSTTSESVTNAWLVNGRLFYSSTASGTYYLKEYVISNSSRKTLLTGVEVYELSVDPANTKQLFINGLNFATNAYIVGSFNPDASSPQATLSTNNKLTGVVETIVILSK